MNFRRNALGFALAGAAALTFPAMLALNYKSIVALFVDTPETSVVHTGLLNFDLTVWSGKHLLRGPGGGLAAAREGVIISHSQTGELQLFEPGRAEIRRLALQLPDNNFSKLPATMASGRAVNKKWIRYNDIEVIEREGTRTLVASYTYFDPARTCFTNRLATIPLTEGWTDDKLARQEAWTIAYESQPCLPNGFSGHQAGGRMALAPDGALYVTIGDFAFDQVSENPAELPVPQAEDNDYGKILKFDPATWSHEQFAKGVRNPQGIAVDREGRVWETEHGAMGGDELNLIRKNGNYGWPYVTLGVNYTPPESDDKSWPPNQKQGRHDGYDMPAWAWVPSIGVSNVKSISNIHPRWDGDLLVSSLIERTLYRVRLTGDRPVYVEPIPLAGRIRYGEIFGGKIYILFDDGAFGVMSPRLTDTHRLEAVPGIAKQPARGPDQKVNAVTAAGCYECHANPSAPNLAKILGSAIASQNGVEYSAGLKAKSGVWSEDGLRDFLADPQKFAPGTEMPKVAISDVEFSRLVGALKALQIPAP